jgi:hypothetical protein
LTRKSRRRSAEAFEFVDRCEYQGGIEVIYVAHDFGSAAHGLNTGVCKIMAVAALVAWQVELVELGIPHSPLGSMSIDSLTAVRRMEYVQSC